MSLIISQQFALFWLQGFVWKLENLFTIIVAWICSLHFMKIMSIQISFKRCFRCQNLTSVAELQWFKVDQNPKHCNLSCVPPPPSPSQPCKVASVIMKKSIQMYSCTWLFVLATSQISQTRESVVIQTKLCLLESLARTPVKVWFCWREKF